MGRTKTSGIFKDAKGNTIIDKYVGGERIYARLGHINQPDAERWLAERVQRIRLAQEGGTRPRVTFREAAAKFLRDHHERLATIDVAAWHIELLDPWIGHRRLEEIHDETLRPFKEHRLKVDGVSLTTVNRAFEVVRRILNLCARAWRHPNGMTWLQTAPLITVERNRAARRPYPLSWEEQDLLFGELPALNRDMALFKVNTGLREQEVCGLRWSWELKVDALDARLFIIPGEYVKNREDRLVVLNGEARAVVDRMRGRHPEFVFAYQRPRSRDPSVYKTDARPARQIHSMNNNAWQSARKRAAARYPEVFGRSAPQGFARVRIHDLKHTFGRRLRAAGVPEETRVALLGHKTRSMPTHYSAAELAELITAANRIDRSLATPAITVLRVAA